jgi:AcrR family transcriptional regulator
MTGIRTQARLETTTEIKRLAREQIASKGAANLSLREIARGMGVASSALYRYFASRDQLLTVLIIESYDDIGDTVERADANCSRHDLTGRWRAVSQSLRNWALTNPSDYGLIFGTPVPGYEAPIDTIAPALRYTNVLLHLLADAQVVGSKPLITIPTTKGVSREYKRVRANLGIKLTDDMLLAGLAAWAALFGAISFELFGHVDTVFTDPETHFRALTEMLGSQMLGMK